MGIEERKTKDGISSWRVQIRKKGFPNIFRSFSSRQEAEKFEKMTLQGMEFSDINPEKNIPTLPLSIWIDRYTKEVIPNKKYGKSEINYLNFWNEHLGNKIAINITSNEIEILADTLYSKMTRHGTFASSETRRKYIVFLSVVYSTAIRDWKWAIHNPVTNIKWEKIKSTYREKYKLPITDEIKEQRMKIVDSFQQKIIEKDFSIRELAKKTGISLACTQRVLSEKNVCINDILIIGDFLGLEFEIKPK